MAVARRLMLVLWPAFVAAGAAELLFFTLFDPADLSVFGYPVELSRQAIYALAFFAFWAIAAASSALTCFLHKTPADVNRCSLPVNERPENCPMNGKTRPGAADDGLRGDQLF